MILLITIIFFGGLLFVGSIILMALLMQNKTPTPQATTIKELQTRNVNADAPIIMTNFKLSDCYKLAQMQMHYPRIQKIVIQPCTIDHWSDLAGLKPLLGCVDCIDLSGVTVSEMTLNTEYTDVLSVLTSAHVILPSFKQKMNLYNVQRNIVPILQIMKDKLQSVNLYMKGVSYGNS